MAKFSGGKLNKDGVLSYVYEAKPGGRKNNINIKNIGGEWFFVNKDGSKRTNLANKGKLSKTHITNLKGAPGSSEENIFASADVSPETGERSTSIDAGGGIDTNARDTVSGPNSIQQNTLAESNYSLPQTELPVSDAQRNFNPATSDAPIQTRKITDNAPGVYSAPAQTMPVNPRQGDYGSTFQKWEGAGNMSLNTDPNSVPSSAVIAPSQSLAGQNEFTGFGQENMSGPGWGAPSTPSGPIAQGGMGFGSEWADKGFTSELAENPNVFQPGSAVDYRQHTGGPVSSAVDARLEAAAAPGVKVEKDNPWGAADWNAVGSVMKGVGGLASAYTGYRNYQLARDAFGAQKDQWQADYNQRLKAYEDNKQLANQEIEARNRTLAARGNTGAKYEKL